MKDRFQEIDFLRGIAILMMIIFHFTWDLNFFFELDISFQSGFWKFFQLSTATLFIVLSGISSYLSFSRGDRFFVFLRRGTVIIFFALLITIVTRFLFPGEYIIFGILHFIGVSMILSYIFVRYKYLNIFTAVVLFLVYIFLQYSQLSHYLLLFFGLPPTDFTSLDYYPLLPWFSIYLIGVFLGGYVKKIPRFSFSKYFFVKNIPYLGRKSLFIYLAHQPVLFLLFYIYFLLNMI